MQPNDHIEPNLDAYLAGGLSANERHDLEQHCAACSACAQQLMEGKQVDQLMDNLFAQIRPDAGLEDRTLERLRRQPAKRYGVMYFVFSAAAVIALGIIGAAAQAMVEGSFGGRVRMAQAVTGERSSQIDLLDDAKSMNDIARGLPTWNLYQREKSGNRKMEAMDLGSEFDTDIKRLDERIEKARLPIQIEPTPSLGMTVIRGEKQQEVAKVEEKESQGSAKVVSVKDIDPAVVAQAIAAIQGKSSTNGGGFQGGGGGSFSGGFGGGIFPGGGGLGGAGFSSGGLAKRGLQDMDGSITGKAGTIVGAPQDYTNAFADKPLGNNVLPNGGAANNYYFGVLPELPKPPLASLNVNDVRAPLLPPIDKAEKKPTYFLPDPGKSDGPNISYDPLINPSVPLGDIALLNPPKFKKRVEESGYDQKKAEEKLADKPAADKKNADAIEKLKPAQKEDEQQPPPALDTGRKIIRTGEMDFEIDSFYASVDTINGLLKKVTKGTGFVATSNSDKLPNGKMKGSVVVRMPPQHLDDFLAELRAALGKVGELKSQRIGSADVTKQYTDIESELRAARAVETRLIEIIKTGKGEIKDLVAAERELGTWRTKIEKMEGEIRYYNNQVALSTLTITLAEKEILAAVAMVLRERVAMNVEVEEVEKAQESIAAGVKAAKGRIVKNDLNVGDAGQVSAIVHVEVPPESAPLFRELLKKLGVVSKYQADRTQQAVGGSAEKSLELKQRTDDVRFELNLYNSANIKPRETLHFKLGVADVAETYRTIREAVAKMKGQIRKSDLNEKDPMNITAELVFNVAATDRTAIDKLVAASGLIVSKHTVQAAINETATERSVGYELALRNIAAIPPRDIFTIAVAAQDVAGSYRKLHDAVVQMKGRIHKGQLNEIDRFNVSAEFDFDAAAADKPALDKLISDIGVTIARKNEQFPAKDESTDQKVGYRLTLKNASGMTPREKAMLAMRVSDVDARAAQLKELVIASKGRVMFSKSERNKNGEMKMVLIFELPHASLDTIVRQIKDGQTPLVYDKELNPQVPDNDLATAQIALTLIAVPDIVPSADEGPLAALHKGLSVAVTILIWCVVFLVSGLAIIVPWLIPIWIVVWLVRRRNAAKTVAVEAPKVG